MAEERVVEIKVDIDSMTFADVEYVLSWSDGLETVKMRELIPFMDRVVIGGIKHLNFRRDFMAIMAAIAESLTKSANPPDTAGQGN